MSGPMSAVVYPLSDNCRAVSPAYGGGVKTYHRFSPPESPGQEQTGSELYSVWQAIALSLS